MSYNLVYFGNQTLKKVATKVKNIDGELIILIDSMYEIMQKEKGIGLAAPQINIGKRIIILEAEEIPYTKLINPVIKEVSHNVEPYEEGCLSLPGILADIIRPSEILVAGVDENGKEVEFEADGLLARVLQHEIDHLEGKVFIDHLEKYIRDEFRSELKKIKKLNKE